MLEGKNIEHQIVDIADPSNSEERKFMVANVSDEKDVKKIPTPQIFSDEEYIGVRLLLLPPPPSFLQLIPAP